MRKKYNSIIPTYPLKCTKIAFGKVKKEPKIAK